MLSCVWLFTTPWTVTRQPPPCIKFSREHTIQYVVKVTSVCTTPSLTTWVFTTYWTIFGQTNPFPTLVGKQAVDKPAESPLALLDMTNISLRSQAYRYSWACQLPTNPEISSSPCRERTGELACPSVLNGRHYYLHCNKLNVLHPPNKIYTLKSNPQCDRDESFGRWLGPKAKPS